ncbi:hypothetical protein, partial [Pseudomonas sp.]|uniref:hypothetical protein n=1 Tax=Pseudomonas sp. TaxID=306 RepID=UPI0037CC92D2
IEVNRFDPGVGTHHVLGSRKKSEHSIGGLAVHLKVGFMERLRFRSSRRALLCPSGEQFASMS